MQKIASLVQVIKDLWPIKINKYSEIWAANYYEQYCIYIYIYIRLHQTPIIEVFNMTKKNQDKAGGPNMFLYTVLFIIVGRPYF